jgi:hypothetical protein
MTAFRSRDRRLLLLVLVGALAVRLATVRFGLPALNDPDELMFEMGALRMLRGPTLDPGWFGHPATTIMYLLAVVNAGTMGFALATGRAASPHGFGELVYADPGWIILPGRVLCVVVAVLVIALAARLAARLFGARAGLAATVLLAVNPVHVFWSPVIRADMLACALMLLCLDAGVDIARRAAPRDFARAAVWLGLAVASKWPFALASLAIAGATLLAARRGVLSPRRGVALLAATAAGAVAVLVVASPFLVLHWPKVVENLRGEGQARHLGATGGDLWWNLRWYAAGAFRSGFGLVGLALLAPGAWAVARRPVAAAVLAPVSLAFVAVLAAQHLVWERSRRRAGWRMWRGAGRACGCCRPCCCSSPRRRLPRACPRTRASG